MNSTKYDVNILKILDLEGNKYVPKENLFSLKRNQKNLEISIFDTEEGDFELIFSTKDLQIKNSDKTIKLNTRDSSIKITTENEFDSISIPIEKELNLETEELFGKNQILAKQTLSSEIIAHEDEMFLFFCY